MVWILFIVLIVISIPIADYYVKPINKTFKEKYCVSIDFDYEEDDEYTDYVNKTSYLYSTKISFNKKYKKEFLDLLNSSELYSEQNVYDIKNEENLESIPFYYENDLGTDCHLFTGSEPRSVKLLYSTVKVSLLPSNYTIITYDKGDKTYAVLVNTFGSYNEQ